MSFFNGDTSVSEQIISSFQTNATISQTSNSGTGTTIDTSYPNIIIQPTNTSGSHYGLLSDGTINGYICRVFVKPNSTADCYIQTDNLAVTADAYGKSLTVGKFYTFIWNPDGTSNKWYYQG